MIKIRFHHSPEKSHILNNDNIARAWYRKHEWPTISATIPVLDDARDLGAHIAATRAKHSATLHDRVDEAITSAHIVNALPLERANKATTVRTHILPKALYGCEVSSAARHVMEHISTVILSLINPATGMRSKDFTYTTCSYGQDLDPDIHVLHRRIMALRRGIAKDPSCIQSVRDLLFFL